jgi:hypothetical protein
MKCQDIQIDLPLYFDDVLGSARLTEIDEHLGSCPLCRQKISEFQAIRNGLRSLDRPSIPPARLAALRAAVASMASPAEASPSFHLLDPRGRWAQRWLMPSTTGALASLVLWFAFLSLLVFPGRTIEIASRAASDRSGSELSAPSIGLIDITPSQFASTRLAIADESPSVNPHGALVALSRSLLGGEMSDEEVVIVADVFGDGLARIAEVVEPAHNERTVIELQKALQSDPRYAPFVPASMDNRGESVRVVLKFQSVDVNASNPPTAN